ncbi:MAG: hypothetical protein IH911_03480 [Proteobacteria bacterium]|nr:hypothetical protein [Pseudomonadota bacterium]
MKDIKQDMLAAYRMIFRPIAKILLRAGVNWKELVEVGKATYVEVASADFGIRGRPTNGSRVAILTGFTRREVRRLRSLLSEEDTTAFDRMNHATRVLSGWYMDPQFCDGNGKPRGLPVAGADVSFETLCRRYASDVPATTMLKELKNVGAVHEDGAGLLLVKTRYYMPVQMDSEQILRSGGVLADIGGTVAHNLHRKADQPTRFERRATSTRMPAEALPQFREFLEQEGQAFLERVDEWLIEHELDDDDPRECIRLGLGAYWIEQ